MLVCVKLQKWVVHKHLAANLVLLLRTSSSGYIYGSSLNKLYPSTWLPPPSHQLAIAPSKYTHTHAHTYTHRGNYMNYLSVRIVAIHPKLTGLCQHEVVSGILKKWKQCGMWNSEEMEAMCASQLWVPGRSCVHGRPYLSFCPVTLQHFGFRCWWVCRWMPVYKRSRLVPFFCYIRKKKTASCSHV